MSVPSARLMTSWELGVLFSFDVWGTIVSELSSARLSFSSSVMESSLRKEFSWWGLQAGSVLLRKCVLKISALSWQNTSQSVSRWELVSVSRLQYLHKASVSGSIMALCLLRKLWPVIHLTNLLKLILFSFNRSLETCMSILGIHILVCLQDLRLSHLLFHNSS